MDPDTKDASRVVSRVAPRVFPRWAILALSGDCFALDTLDEKLLAASVAVMRKATPRNPVVSAAALENPDRFNVEAGLMRADEKLPSYDGLFTDEYVK